MKNRKMLTAAAIMIATISAFAIVEARSGTISSVQVGDACIQSASFLKPLSGESIHLDRFDGVLYYTIEHDGYRVVATLASGPGSQPIRFVATLVPDQHIALSVPEDAGQKSVEFTVSRAKDSLVVGYAAPCLAAN